MRRNRGIFRVCVLAAAATALLALSGCGSENTAQVSAGGAGFWNGLWDGLTIWFAFVGDLLGLGDWNIYEIHNNGGWYNFGFLLGVGSALGGGSAAISSTRS